MSGRAMRACLACGEPFPYEHDPVCRHCRQMDGRRRFTARAPAVTVSPPTEVTATARQIARALRRARERGA